MNKADAVFPLFPLGQRSNDGRIIDDVILDGGVPVQELDGFTTIGMVNRYLVRSDRWVMGQGWLYTPFFHLCCEPELVGGTWEIEPITNETDEITQHLSGGTLRTVILGNQPAWAWSDSQVHRA